MNIRVISAVRVALKKTYTFHEMINDFHIARVLVDIEQANNSFSLYRLYAVYDYDGDL